MKTFKLLTLFASVSLMLSCASMSYLQRIHNIEVGASKQEVIGTLGNQYTLMHSALGPQGEKIEILHYSDIYGRSYELEFYNEILVRVTKVIPPPQKECDHHHTEEGHPHKH